VFYLVLYSFKLFREAVGFFPGSFRKSSGKLSEIFREADGNLPGSCRKSSGKSSGKASEIFWEAFRKRLLGFQGMFLEASRKLPGGFWEVCCGASR